MSVNRSRRAPIYAQQLIALACMVMAGTAQSFDLQGHRGARGLMPENSLAGFAKALSIGVTTLELDLALTRDLQVVVSHNSRFEPAIARDSAGDWLRSSSNSIHSMTLAEAKTFDIGRLNPGHDYAARFPAQQGVDGSRIPTLEAVFALAESAGNNQVLFNIEVKINPLKPGLTHEPKTFVDAVLRVVKAGQMESRTTIQSFDWRVLREVQRQAPEIATAYLSVNQSWFDNLAPRQAGASPWLAGYDIDDFEGKVAPAVKAAGGVIWSPYHREVDAESIREAHDLGLLVKVWTVNESERMRQLIAMDVDGIITDYPDRLRRVMQTLGMPLPVATPSKKTLTN